MPEAPSGDEPRRLPGLRVAVARDEAFAFIYPANLAWLRSQGARLIFFSPLRDRGLPECDAVWLPGGYPELHLPALSANRGLLAAIRAHAQAGRPVVAECGGLLYLLDGLRGLDGVRHPLAGVLPGEGEMTRRIQGLGMQAWEGEGGTLRGHAFHYARARVSMAPAAHARRHPDGAQGEAVYRRDAVWASFLHLYFPSAPEAAARLFRGA